MGVNAGLSELGQIHSSLSGVSNFLDKGTVLGDVARGAASSAITQGVATATGLQDKFSFAGVAAAGVAAGVGGLISRSLTPGERLTKDTLVQTGEDSFKTIAAGTWRPTQAASFGTQAAVGAASLFASAATRSAIEGSSFGKAIEAGLPDVIGQIFGRALGGAIAEKVIRGPEEQVERRPSEETLSSLDNWAVDWDRFAKPEEARNQAGNFVETLQTSDEVDPAVLQEALAEEQFQQDVAQAAANSADGNFAQEPIVRAIRRVGGDQAAEVTQEALRRITQKDPRLVPAPLSDSGFRTSDIVNQAANTLVSIYDGVDYVDTLVREKVWGASLALEAVAFATGPVSYIAGKVIMASPLGSVIEENVASGSRWLADWMRGKGIDPVVAAKSAGALIFIGSLTFGAKRALDFFGGAKNALGFGKRLWNDTNGSVPNRPFEGLSPERRRVSNPALERILDSNYGANGPNGSRVGSGSTADALRYERSTGQLLSPAGHGQKAQDLLNRLRDERRRAEMGPNPNSNGTIHTNADVEYMDELIEDLENAISGN